MDQPVLIEERRDAVAVLTLNRPERMNALNGDLMDALLEATRRLAEDETVRAVVLTGAGASFCAGGDIKEGSQRRSEPGAPRPTPEEQARDRHARMLTSKYLQEMPKPTLAMLRGAVMGAGLSLAMACDLRIAGTTATFKTAFANAALSGDYGIGRFLLRAVGRSRAVELMLLSEKLDAMRAAELGLVHRVVADERLEDEALSLAARLAVGPTVAYAAIKANLEAALSDLPLEDYLLVEARAQTRCHHTEDVKEAARAFLQKRPPQFKGR